MDEPSGQKIRTELKRTVECDKQRDILLNHLQIQHYPQLFGDQVMDKLRELSVLVTECNLPFEVIQDVMATIIWVDRDSGVEYSGISDYRSLTAGSPNISPLLLSLTYHYVLGRLRCDFKFKAMLREVKSIPNSEIDDEIAALSVFAKMGLRTDEALREYHAFWDTYEGNKASFDILLHALWFGTHIVEQGAEIINLSDRMLSLGLASANLYYWRAFAYRRIQEFTKARTEILTAIDMLPVGKNDVHRDYSRERELIDSSMILNLQATKAVMDASADLAKDVEARAREAEHNIARSTINIIEILGLFTALIGFFAAGGVTMFHGGLPFWQRVVLLVLVFIGAIGFILTLHVLIHTERRRWNRSYHR